ncbi:GAF domain-containing protein [Marinibaculum pumilum]|uniref:GAF domain-containing protein n=1 Tax=Marinibaculum pumilum TaxID=1766165 RepID=A0ABV7KWU2_9PROT
MAEQTEQPGRTIMPSAPDRRSEADRRLRERRLPDGMSRHEGPAGEEVFLDENLRPRQQWLTASIELVVFFAMALLFDALVLDGNRFLEVEPSPFWIAVIVLTVQYGTSYGLLAAITSTIVLYAGNLPQQQIAQDLYDYLFHIFATPMLWLVSAVLLGAIRDRQVADRAALREQLARSRAQAAAIADRYEKLKDAKREVEARLASQLRTVTSLYRGASALERLTVQEVLDGFDDIFSAVMDAETYSLYLLSDDGLEVARTVGWREGDRWQRFFGHDHMLLQAVVGQLDFAIVNEPEGERLLAGEGLMAGPVVDPQDQSLIGMIKVERVPFSQLDYEAVDRFEIICSWVGAALSRARRFEKADADRLTRDGLMLSTAAYQHQKRFLERLAGRSGFAASMLVIRPPAEMSGDPEMLARLRNSLAYAVQKILRTTDEAYEIDDDGFSFAVMLPGARTEDARMLAERLRVAMAEKLDEVHEGTPWADRVEFGVEALSRPQDEPPRATLSDLGVCVPE